MASTASPLLGIELQALGENDGTWGQPRLNEALKRLEEGVAKVQALTITADYELDVQNFIEDEARSAVLALTGTPGTTYTITIPQREKVYLVYNGTDANQLIGASGGDTATLIAGAATLVWCDGTDTFAGPSTSFDASAAFSATSTTANAIGTGSKTYTVASGKAFWIGETVRIADNAAPGTNYMDGYVTSYSGTSLVVMVTSVAGSGTPASVTIAFSQAQVTLPDQTGNAGKYLTTNGTVSSWADVPADDIAPGTPTDLSNVAAASFAIDATKNLHIFELQSVIPVTDDVALLFLASSDGGGSYGVSCSATIQHFGTTITDAQQISTTGVNITNTTTNGVGSAANEYGVTGRATFSQLSGTYGVLNADLSYVAASGTFYTVRAFVIVSTTTAITHIRFQFSSGNMESGRIIPITVDA